MSPLDSDDWRRLFGDSTYQYTFDDDDFPDGALPPVEQALYDDRREVVARAMDDGFPVSPLPVPPLWRK